MLVNHTKDTGRLVGTTWILSCDLPISLCICPDLMGSSAERFLLICSMAGPITMFRLLLCHMPLIGNGVSNHLPVTDSSRLHSLPLWSVQIVITL